VIGLMTIHVFGFERQEAIPLAEKTGIAFQLTTSCGTSRKTRTAGASICRWRTWRVRE